jgi:tetratricopeptide (TPR) repeat protein
VKPNSDIPQLLVSILNSVSLVALILGGTLAQAQKKGAGPPPSLSLPNQGQAQTVDPHGLEQTNLVFDRDDSTAPKNAKGNCFLPPLNALNAGMIGVADLQVPAKSQMEYEDGCAAVKRGKVSDAESHLRKAEKQDPKYPAAWVLLGQVLQQKHQIQEAQDACSRPLSFSSSYLPAYLCLTDISARSQNWDQVLKLSSRALEIDPTENVATYAYNAAANLHLHHLPQAEKSALRASEMDRNNADPRLHFLLAQIYTAKGDLSNATAQLREYLRYATDPDDVALVNKYLTEIGKYSGR